MKQRIGMAMFVVPLLSLAFCAALDVNFYKVFLLLMAWGLWYCVAIWLMNDCQ